MIKLQTVRSELPHEVAVFLRELADKADAGEIVGVTCIAEHPVGTYSVVGTRTLSRLQTMGALMEAVFMRSGMEG